jgi:hypothetical protein
VIGPCIGYGRTELSEVAAEQTRQLSYFPHTAMHPIHQVHTGIGQTLALLSDIEIPGRAGLGKPAISLRR